MGKRLVESVVSHWKHSPPVAAGASAVCSVCGLGGG